MLTFPHILGNIFGAILLKITPVTRKIMPFHFVQVEFPSKPSVSAEAKEFIRRCLAYRQEMRWDVQTAAQDPYLCLSKSAAAVAAASAAASKAATKAGGGGTSGFEGLLREL